MLREKKNKMNQEQKEVLKDKLDIELNHIENNRSKGRSKFERTRDVDSEGSDNDYEDIPKRSFCYSLNDDVVMTDITSDKSNLNEIDLIISNDDNENSKLRQIKRPFRTLESKVGMTFKSQNWRLRNSNPPHNLNRVLNGRIKKVTQSKPCAEVLQRGSLYITYQDSAP